jgi:hypothetical protein
MISYTMLRCVKSVATTITEGERQQKRERREKEKMGNQYVKSARRQILRSSKRRPPSSKRKGDYTMRMRKAAEAGTMYCCVCRTYQAKDLFYRRYRHTVHHTIVKCDTKTCGPCLDTMYVSNKESLAVYRKEKIKEKILGLVTQSPRCVSCR